MPMNKKQSTVKLAKKYQNTQYFDPETPCRSIDINGIACPIQYTGRHWVVSIYGIKTVVCHSWDEILEVRDTVMPL